MASLDRSRNEDAVNATLVGSTNDPSVLDISGEANNEEAKQTVRQPLMRRDDRAAS